MKKIIRIQAKCDTFEIDEQIEESECEKRLKQIREYHLGKKITVIKHVGRKRHTFIYKPHGELKVTTSVVNPKLF